MFLINFVQQEIPLKSFDDVTFDYFVDSIQKCNPDALTYIFYYEKNSYSVIEFISYQFKIAFTLEALIMDSI